MRDVKKTFLDFMDRVPFYGMIVACNDDPLLRTPVARSAAAHRDLWDQARLRFSDQARCQTQRSAPQITRPYSRFRVTYRRTGSGRIHAARARAFTTC